MKKAFVNQRLCVACGSCITACRLGAISISKGVCAVINTDKCVGCGMCAKTCPAGIISVKEAKHGE